MKRTIGPFAVEYKRRAKRAKASNPSIWGDALGDEVKALLQTKREEDSGSSTDTATPQKGRAGEALFRAKDASQRPARILESQDSAITDEAEEIPAAPDEDEADAPPPPRARRLRSGPAARMAPQPEPESAPEPASREAIAPAAQPPAPPAAAARPVEQGDTPARPLAPSVARRRARMKGLNFEDRWKWNLL